MASRHKLIKWFKDQQGLVTYSKTNRRGPSSFDSAGAMFSALIYSDFLPDHTWIGDISLLRQLEGSLLQPINFKQIRRGDIFISCPQDPKSVQEGHTGVVIDRHRMIYCSEEYNGIVISKFKTWPGQKISWYRLAEPVKKRNSLIDKVQQCFSRYNRRRALQVLVKLDQTKEDSLR